MKSFFILLSLLIHTYGYSTTSIANEYAFTSLDMSISEYSDRSQQISIFDRLSDSKKLQIQKAVDEFYIAISEYKAELEPAIKDTFMQQKLLEQQLTHTVQLNESASAINNVPPVVQVIAEKQQMLNNLSAIQTRIVQHLTHELRTKIIFILGNCLKNPLVDSQAIVDNLLIDLLNRSTPSHSDVSDSTLTQNTDCDLYIYSDTYQDQDTLEYSTINENIDLEYFYTE